MAESKRAQKPEVEKLVERKLQIAAEVSRLRAEGARLNQEMFRIAPGDERVSRFITAW